MTLPRFQLFYSVFVAGLTILFVEIAGARFLAPHFGSSLYVWSALISVTLLSIAFGAWWGGRLADLYPGHKILSILWFGAALCLGLIPPLRSWVVPMTEVLDLRVGVFTTATLLYFIPLALLSAIPPLAVKMADPSRERLGRTVGLLSALGTAGSFAGSMLTGFVLVPNFSMTQLFQGFSVILALSGWFCAWNLGKRATLTAGVLLWAGGLVLFGGGAKEGMARFGDQVVSLAVQRNSLYGQLKVVDMGRFRMLLMDNIMQGGVLWPEGRTLYPYASYMEVLSLACVPQPKRVLMVGLGAGVIPTWFARRGCEVDAVDINEQMLELARDWFGLRVPPVRVFIDDGRRYLQKCPPATYDLVLLDAYNGEEVPTHLVTEEAYAAVKRVLKPGGAFLTNYVAYREKEKGRMTASIARAMEVSFPSVEVFASGKPGELNNLIIVARTQPGPYSGVPSFETSGKEPLTLADVLKDRVEIGEPYQGRLTDEYAPVEWLERRVRFVWRKEMLGHFGAILKTL
jgi:spermidine synthase